MACVRVRAVAECTAHPIFSETFLSPRNGKNRRRVRIEYIIEGEIVGFSLDSPR